MNGKTIAIITHIPIIGWIIGWILNMEAKDEFAAFYNRQMLGISILWILLAMIPIVGWLAGTAVFVLWIMSFVAVFRNQKEPTPFIGRYFQEWFKSL